MGPGSLMFDFSFSELAVIGVVALVAIGPERLPKVARTAGKLLGRVQGYINTVKSDIEREMQLEELKDLQNQVRKQAEDLQKSLQEQAHYLEADLRDTAAELKETIHPDLSSYPQTRADSPETISAPFETPPPSTSAQLELGFDFPPPASPAASEKT